MKQEYHLKPSVLKVNNIWAEDLFEWFWETMYRDGGDGGSKLVCKNPQKVAEMFEKWYKWHYKKGITFERVDKSEHEIHWTSGQDFATISDDAGFMNPFHEYTFIVEGDCVFGWTEELKNEVIEPADDTSSK